VTRWFPSMGDAGPEGPLVLCVNGAGGGTAEFRQWTDMAAGRAWFVPVVLPGRERRIAEPLPTRLPDLVADLAAAVARLPDRSVSFFGYSLGALITFELSRALPSTVRHLFVGGQRPPNLPQGDPVVSTASDDELTAYLRDLGGTPGELLADAHFMRHYLRWLRADMSLAEGYRHEPGSTVACPVTLFTGASDHTSDAGDWAGWRSMTRAAFTHVRMPGGHFFLRSEGRAIVDHVCRTLTGPA
jgi:surfactin synthase thioesterase subunit